MPDISSTVSGEVWRALRGSYGVQTTITSDQAKRKHLALCNEDRRTCGRPEFHKETGDAVPQGTIHEGTGPETTAGTDGTEQGEGQRAISVFSVPRRDRAGVRPKAPDDGTNSSAAEATEADRQVSRIKAGIERLREKLARPGAEHGGATDRDTVQIPGDPSTMQMVLGEDRQGSGSRDEKAMAPKPRTAVKRGRPKVHKDARERWREAKRRKRAKG